MCPIFYAASTAGKSVLQALQTRGQSNLQLWRHPAKRNKAYGALAGWHAPTGV